MLQCSIITPDASIQNRGKRQQDGSRAGEKMSNRARDEAMSALVEFYPHARQAPRAAPFHSTSTDPCFAENPPAGDSWAHELKFDGYRLHACIADKRAKLLTRTGLNWTAKYEAVAGASQVARAYRIH
jgi:hypothetical protein